MMKRKLTALLCALLIGCGAMAEAPAPSPTPEIAETIQTAGSMSVTFNDEALTLDFDPDPMYSICRDGYVQSSFYAYGEGDLLYELYMTFPQSVLPGETVTPESSLKQADLFSGLYLYVSTTESETCSAATQFLTGAYPEGSSYSIAFSDISSNGSVSTFTGTVEAKMIELDANYNPTSKINDFSASFTFSMDLGSETAQPEPRLPESSAEPVFPEPSPDIPEEKAPENEFPKNEFPYPLPDAYANPYPPTPPSQLITPSNAQKI